MAEIVRTVLAVDVVCFRVGSDPRSPYGGLDVLLGRRRARPTELHTGDYAVPGGTVHEGELLEEAARRVLRERTGLEAPFLAPTRTRGPWIDTPAGRVLRDDRGPSTSAAYVALLPEDAPVPVSGGNLVEVAWVPEADLPGLPMFLDHADIIADARSYVARLADREPVAFRLVPERFAMSELRDVHAALTGGVGRRGERGERSPYDLLQNFTTMIQRQWDVEQLAEYLDTPRGRPPRLYRFVDDWGWFGPPAALPARAGVPTETVS